jgi:hypothetical protein
MKDSPAKPAADLTREFIYSIELPDTDETATLQKLREAFPELIWRDGEGNFGKISLAGESAETPPETGIFLLRKEHRGPGKLTIRLQQAGLIKAEELKDKLLQALPGASVSTDPLPFPPQEDSIPWVNVRAREPRTAPPLPPIGKSTAGLATVDLKTPVDRPVVAIFKFGMEILISRDLLEAMGARADEITAKTPANQVDGDERREMFRGARARGILRASVPTGSDGNLQVPLAALPTDSLHVLAELLENGLVEVVCFNSYGQALSPKKISVRPFGVRAGPTAGFGMVFFSVEPFGPEILGLNTWVS